MLGKAAARRSVGNVHQFVDAVSAIDAVVPGNRIEHRVGPGQAGGVRGHGGDPGIRCADLHHDQWLAVAPRQLERGDQSAPVANPLDAANDHVSGGVGGHIGQEVGHLDVALVACCRPQVERQPALAHQREAVRSERSRLAGQANATRRRWRIGNGTGEGREDAASGVDGAHAIGAKQAQPGAARNGDDFVLRALTLTIGFGKAR